MSIVWIHKIFKFLTEQIHRKYITIALEQQRPIYNLFNGIPSRKMRFKIKVIKA